VELVGEPISLFFVDIGGDRAMQSVCVLMDKLLHRFHPRLLVVKSEQLYKAATTHKKSEKALDWGWWRGLVAEAEKGSITTARTKQKERRAKRRLDKEVQTQNSDSNTSGD